MVYKYGVPGPTDEQRALTTMENKRIGLRAGKKLLAALQVKKPKKQSRPQRWADACAELRTALDGAKEKIDAILGPVSDALGTLVELKGEYEEWMGKLPDSLSSSPVAEKLEAVTGLEIPDEATAENLDEVESALDECESADLPRGFGND